MQDREELERLLRQAKELDFKTVHIRDRIKDFRRVKASELRPNPKNWREHPERQREALKSILAAVGYVDALLARELDDGSLMLIDGHLRAETTPDSEVPVLVLDVTQDEADQILATLDPLTGLAEIDQERFHALLDIVKLDNEALEKHLHELAGMETQGEPVGDPLNGLVPDGSRYNEQYGVIVICEDEAHQERIFNELSEKGYNVRVVVT